MVGICRVKAYKGKGFRVLGVRASAKGSMLARKGFRVWVGVSEL